MSKQKAEAKAEQKEKVPEVDLGDAQSKPPPYDGPVTTQPGPSAAAYYPPPSNQIHPMMQPPQPGHSNMGQTSTNTVIVNQQGPMSEKKMPRMWHTGVFSFCDDIGICCCVLFCPSYLAVRMSTDMGESCCVPCCVPGWLIALRVQMRAKENIQGSIMDDCVMAHFCCQCVMCQLAREIKHVRNQEMARQ